MNKKGFVYFFILSFLFLVNHNAFSSEEGVLTLEKTLEIVDKNHPKLASANRTKRMARAKRIEKQGAFDPKLTVDSDYMRYNNPSERGESKEATDNELSLGFLTRSGIQISPGIRYNMGSVKFPLSPTGDTGEYFTTIKAPLLRGFIVNDKSISERQAIVGESLADTEFYRTRLEILLNSSNAYWNWVSSKLKMDVASKLLDIAKFRAQAIKQRADQGDLPKIDIVEADQEVFRRQEVFIKTRRDFQNYSFKLALYLWDNNGKPYLTPAENNIPKKIEEPKDLSKLDSERAITSALTNRPEITSILLEKKITELDLKLAKNDVLPDLTVFANPGIDTGGKSIGPTIKAGVNLNANLRQRAARGRMETAKLKLEKLDLEKKNLELEIETEVKDVISEINATFERYVNANKELELAKKLEEGEREKFKYGDSTLFLVNQRERTRAEAEMKVVDILAEYKKSIVVIEAVKANL